MLLCFGAAWPFSLWRSWRSRSVRGKSLLFLLVILLGYLAGIAHKLLQGPDWVLSLYVLNALVVSADIGLYVRNRAYERPPNPGQLKGPSKVRV
jgi:hypothetical protein